MPAQFAVNASDLKVILRELRELDPNLKKELQKEMRTELKPFVQKLKGGIPSESPLSGFANAAPGSRYRWTPVTGTTKTPLGKRAKKPGFYPVVSMSFRSRNKGAGFEIMELAGSKTSGRTPQGRAMIAALAERAPIVGGLGRFVIPEGKKEAPEATKVAKDIIRKFADKVSRRLR